MARLVIVGLRLALMDGSGLCDDATGGGVLMANEPGENSWKKNNCCGGRSQKRQEQQPRQIQGFFPFDYAQGQNDDVFRLFEDVGFEEDSFSIEASF